MNAKMSRRGRHFRLFMSMPATYHHAGGFIDGMLIISEKYRHDELHCVLAFLGHSPSSGGIFMFTPQQTTQYWLRYHYFLTPRIMY